MPFNVYHYRVSTTLCKTIHSSSKVCIGNSSHPLQLAKLVTLPLAHSTLVSVEIEEERVEELYDEQTGEVKIKWHDVGSNLTDAQTHAISQISPKMTNRCKALLKRIICFSSQDENLSHILAAWVKVMKPRRADWLSIFKEMCRTNDPLLTEVMECALLEDSFEANVRDYTKLIDIYANNNLIINAENAYNAMKSRSILPDQVMLTVLIKMYSNAGNLNKSIEAFNEIQFLNLPLDKRVYGSMITAYISAGLLGHAEKVMKEMEAKEIFAGREVYKALLRAYSKAGDADGAQRVFDAIQFARIVPDDKHCALLVNAYCLAGQNEKACRVLENMRSVGLKPNEKCIALMIEAYEKEDRLDKAMEIMKSVEDEGIIIGQETVNLLENWFQRLGVVDDELVDVLKELCAGQKARFKSFRVKNRHKKAYV